MRYLLTLLFAALSLNAVGQDTTPPELIDFSISDTEVVLSDNEGLVLFNILSEDDLSGIYEVILTLRYNQFVYTYSDNSCNNELLCSSEFNIDFNGWDPGQYQVDKIQVLDLLGNINTYGSSYLESLGYDVYFCKSSA